MKILANKHLYRIREFFPKDVVLNLFDPNTFPSNAPEYDVLLINTTTAINRETLPDPGNLQIIATGSSGHDHVDTEYLDSIGVRFEAASGCNAQSVAEYVITAIICYSDENQVPLNELKVGIAGCGHTGQAVSAMLDRFSISKTEYDPPRQNREPVFRSALFEQFSECNVLTFHTPFTDSGDHPTKHLLNSSWFERKKYELVINAARGGVVDEKALLKNLGNGNLRSTVLDVWENEPFFNDSIAGASRFATPHIAGYSVQSKLRASKMVADALGQFAGLEIPKPESPGPVKVSIDYNDNVTLGKLLAELHSISRYDNAFKKITGFSNEEKKKAFYNLRTTHPLRHEFSNISVPAKLAEQFSCLKKLNCKFHD